MINCSIVIRTFNEEKYLPKVLKAIRGQSFSGNKEVIVVDSGSTDDTVQIAASYGCRIVYIEKSDFSFGRSLNYGCREAKGELLIFISAHCIPVNEYWLDELIKPFVNKKVVMSYGRQMGIESSKFSEKQLLKKYFPENADLKQQGYFSNNANSCIRRDKWKDVKFDEELTGLEDMAWAKYWYLSGYEIAYCPKSIVYHIHSESWKQVLKRYEREAYAMKDIMPEVHVSVLDMVRYIFMGILLDSRVAISEGKFLKRFRQICFFRYNQYLGTYIGNHIHRKLSKEKKEKYYYPN